MVRLIQNKQAHLKKVIENRRSLKTSVLGRKKVKKNPNEYRRTECLISLKIKHAREESYKLHFQSLKF